MRTTYLPVLALTGLLVVAACSSTTTKPVPTTPPTTTVELPTTTSPPPATTTTAAPTTTTIEPPPTTVPDAIAAIKQAVLDYEDVRYACMQDPATCDASSFARGELLSAEQSFIGRVVGLRGHSTRPGDDAPYWVFGEASISPDGLNASIDGCFWETTVLAGEGGTIINGDKVTYRMTIGLVREADKWWLATKFINRRIPAVNDCGPRQ
jgi:hypothetical protein